MELADGARKARDLIDLQLSAADPGVRLRQICLVDHSTSRVPHVHTILHFSDGSSSQWIRLDVMPSDLRSAGASLGYSVAWHLHAPEPSKGVEPSLLEALHACSITLTESEAQILCADTCAVCLGEYEAGEELICMPCDAQHKVHWGCIAPWLKEHNSCPTCRFELPIEGEEMKKGEIERLRERSRAGIDALRAAAALHAAGGGLTCANCDGEETPTGTQACVCCVPGDVRDDRRNGSTEARGSAPGLFAAFKRIARPRLSLGRASGCP